MWLLMIFVMQPKKKLRMVIRMRQVVAVVKIPVMLAVVVMVAAEAAGVAVRDPLHEIISVYLKHTVDRIKKPAY